MLLGSQFPRHGKKHRRYPTLTPRNPDTIPDLRKATFMSTHTELTPAEAADRLAVRELFDAYARCADRRDAERQKALFTTDTRFAGDHPGADSHPRNGVQRRAPHYAPRRRIGLVVRPSIGNGKRGGDRRVRGGQSAVDWRCDNHSEHAGGVQHIDPPRSLCGVRADQCD